VEADGPRLGEDLERAKEDGAVGGRRTGGGDLRRVAAGDNEEAPEAEHVGRAELEQQVRRSRSCAWVNTGTLIGQ